MSPIFGNKKENTIKQQIVKILSSEEMLKKDEYYTGFLILTTNNLIWENKKGKSGSSIIIPLESIQSVECKHKLSTAWNLKITYEQTGKVKEKMIPLSTFSTSLKGDVEKWVNIIREIKSGKMPSKQTIIERFDVVTYIGGHSSSSEKHVGKILLTEKELIFEDNQSANFVLKIPYQKIEKLSVKTTTEINKLRTVLAGPMWSMGFPDTNKFVLIEYVDKVGMSQTPLFDSRNKTKDRIMKTLYEKIKNIRKTEAPITQEDPLRVLKLRYAKGEITKEEYEEIKRLLEE